MSTGWIKVEKDLLTDPRLIQMASRLSHADVTLGSRSSVAVLGALIRLWCFADTHIRDDNTLECSAEDIDDLVGIANFCQLMPPDWLHSLSANRVQLPDFLVHNGIQAKKRAQAQRRKKRQRAKVTLESRKNGDQTQDRETDTNTKDPKNKPLPLVDGLDTKAWEIWVAYRREKGRPLTATSIAIGQISLAKYGTEQQAKIDRAITNGWQGFDFENGASKREKKHRPPKTEEEYTKMEKERGDAPG